MDFKRLSHAMLVKYYSKICESRGIELKKGAADIIATSADGSVRDGLSILEQSLASGEKVITEDIVNLYGGAVSQKFLIDLTNCVLKGDVAGGIVSINSQIEDGKESGQILKDWIRHFRNLMVAKVVDNPSTVINLSSESVGKIVESCKGLPYEKICDGLKILAEADKDSRGSAQPRIFLDLALMKLSSLFNEKKIVNPGGSDSLEARQGVMRLSPADTISSESRQQFSKNETKEQQPDSAEKQQLPIDDEVEKSVESESNREASSEKAEKQKNDNLDSTEEMEDAENMDDVWASICEMVVKERPSIGTLKQRAKINNISQNTITIEAENEITAKRLEDGMQIISEAATVVLGRPIRGQIAVQGRENKLANSDDDTIQRLKELLGDIPIKMQ